MHVLIAGGTGFVGSHLCAEFLDRGHEVVALARHPDESAVPNEVERRRGDITEYEGLEESVQGVDALVNLVALSPLYQPKGGEKMHERVHVQGTRNLVRAMEAVGIDRLIQVSALDADPDGQTAFLRAKGRAEGIVRSAELSPTILRPPVVFGEGSEFVPFVKRVTTPFLTGLPSGGQTRFQPIWVGDFAALLADAIEEPRHVGATYEIGGPEVLTLAAVTKAVYRANGRSVRIVPIPMPLAGIALTLAGPLPLIPFGREQYRSLRLDNTVETNDIEAFDRRAGDLMAFDGYLEDRARQK